MPHRSESELSGGTGARDDQAAAERRKARPGVRRKLGLVAGLFGVTGLWLPWAGAMHEADHRFTVDGYVCGPDGTPVKEAAVLVKDTRVTVGATVYTDAGGYYKTILHLHNDNLGDPLLVEVGNDKQERKIEFDPKDTESERGLRVNFGAGCEQLATRTPPWVYVGGGLGAIVLAAVMGRKRIRKWWRGRQPTQGAQKKR
jgi:hypothetical protein